MAGMRFIVTILMASLVAIAASAAPARASEVALGESGGIYTVPGEVNRSVTLQFLVDPGSAVVVIPRAALRQLVANGTVTENDVVGISIAELADRSLYQTARIRLRELRVGNEVAHDIIAAVSPGLSHPLLGQTFLRRFASVTIDNQRRTLILSGAGLANSAIASSGWAGAPQYPAVAPSPYYPAPPSAFYGSSSPPPYWAR
jgi:predicted aspartyl protease